MLITLLVILTYSFQVAAILVWPIFAILQLFQYFPTEVIQIDSEWPILAGSQLFQYFPTEVVQIDSEWSILAVLPIFSNWSGPN